MSLKLKKWIITTFECTKCTYKITTRFADGKKSLYCPTCGSKLEVSTRKEMPTRRK